MPQTPRRTAATGETDPPRCVSVPRERARSVRRTAAAEPFLRCHMGGPVLIAHKTAPGACENQRAAPAPDHSKETGPFLSSPSYEHDHRKHCRRPSQPITKDRVEQL